MDSPGQHSSIVFEKLRILVGVLISILGADWGRSMRIDFGGKKERTVSMLWGLTVSMLESVREVGGLVGGDRRMNRLKRWLLLSIMQGTDGFGG